MTTRIPQGDPVTASQIESWLTDLLLREMNVAPSNLAPDRRLSLCGIDSLQMVSLIGQLESWLGCHFTSNPLDRYPSLRSLSNYLARQLAAGRTTLDPASADEEGTIG